MEIQFSSIENQQKKNGNESCVSSKTKTKAALHLSRFWSLAIRYLLFWHSDMWQLIGRHLKLLSQKRDSLYHAQQLCEQFVRAIQFKASQLKQSISLQIAMFYRGIWKYFQVHKGSERKWKIILLYLFVYLLINCIKFDKSLLFSRLR